MQTTHSIKFILKNALSYCVVFVLSAGTLLLSGGAAFADEVACDPTPPPDSSYGAGVHHPNGTDGGTFSYHCETDTWSNPYYIYYPASVTRVATFDRNYAYNCTTGLWTMDEWGYSAATGTFNSYRVATTSPGLATNCPVPIPAAPSGASNPNGGSSISDTGTDSTNTTGNDITLGGTSTNTNTLNANNILINTAGTGNATVTGNTIGGSAGSGDAMSLANIANLLQSSTNAFGPGTAVFTANINGDVNGDFMFDPSAIMNTGSGSSNSASNNLQINTTDTNTTNAQINNNINVGATTGNAAVTDNTKGGDATSGNAQAIVNLMNLINSTVASGQSFVGTININGNLNGDILLPQGLIDQLLATTGTNSTNNLSNQYTDNSTTTNTVTQSVANNLQSSSLTGSANVVGNTPGGSATSGQAQTGVTILNLTGSNVIAKNSLLVFVNVLGTWVGMIMNAPTGTNAAQLAGGSINKTGSGSTNSANNTVTDNSTTTNTANLGITNNINVHAQSGNATVSGNTVGGNATSGNASTAVNVLNLMGSNISVSDWFGVLFINVFGLWNGSFGVNTSAGDPVSNPSNNTVQAANQAAQLAEFHQFASFRPSNSNSGGSSDTGATETGTVLGSRSIAPVAEKIAVATPLSSDKAHANMFLPAVGAGLALLILAFSERDRLFKRR